MQLAACFGVDVTAGCTTSDLETVRSLGAGRVIDQSAEDVTRDGQAYDVIYDADGKHSFRPGKASPKPGGIYLATPRLGQGGPVLAGLGVGAREGGGVFPKGRHARSDVVFLNQPMEAGRHRAVIDRS